MTGRAAAIAALVAFLGGLAVATFSEYRELFPFLLRGTLFAVQIALLSALFVFAIVFIVRAGRQNALRPARLLAGFSKLARSAQRLRESESFTVAGRAAVIASLVAFLAGLSVATFSEYRVFLPALLRGTLVTIQVSLLSAILFYAMAFLSGVGRLSALRPVRILAGAYVEVFRGTSLLVILFWFFFVLPELGVVLSPLTAAVLGVGLNFGAYGAEVVRGAITSVPKGQYEAATALNIPGWKPMLRIVLPQAIPVAVPGLANLTIEMVKATALVSAVTMVDITFAAVRQNQIYYQTIDIFVVTLLLYYCLSQLVRFGASLLEARMTRHRLKAA